MTPIADTTIAEQSWLTILLAEIDARLDALATPHDRIEYLDWLQFAWRRRRGHFVDTGGASELLLQPRYRLTLADLATMLLAIGARRVPLVRHGDNAPRITTSTAPIELAAYRNATPMAAMEAWC